MFQPCRGSCPGCGELGISLLPFLPRESGASTSPDPLILGDWACLCALIPVLKEIFEDLDDKSELKFCKLNFCEVFNLGQSEHWLAAGN